MYGYLGLRDLRSRVVGAFFLFLLDAEVGGFDGGASNLVSFECPTLEGQG